jgi:hypothetical protein
MSPTASYAWVPGTSHAWAHPLHQHPLPFGVFLEKKVQKSFNPKKTSARHILIKLSKTKTKTKKTQNF